MSVYQLIQLGRKYLQLWPQRAELANYFSEYNIIIFCRFVFRYFPALAIFSLLLPLIFNINNAYPQAFFYALFIASMPIQALVMLGVKADKFLPPSLASWYKEGVAKVNEQGGEIKLSLHKPRYLDLAQLLNLSYQRI
ncbi:MAG: hypothetical protein COB35_06485 [Gammaproteobacteria bacterium]|nr:MAG: hypothetical protein COB35_06485 [Gammaproteobacteria bacterium]